MNHLGKHGISLLFALKWSLKIFGWSEKVEFQFIHHCHIIYRGSTFRDVLFVRDTHQ